MKDTRKVRALIDEARKTSERFDNPQFMLFYAFALEQWHDHGNKAFFDFITTLREPPASIETFLDSHEFMGSTDLKLWPQVRQTIIDLNKNWWKGKQHGAYTEILCSGATGTGKSEIAKVTTAYHLHILGCMRKPQVYWSLPSSTSILLPIFAAKPRVTKNILYMPLRAYVEVMPWFQKNMRFDPYLESEMVFEENNIRVVPVGADVDAVLGEALPGGIIDEINFMQVVEHSKKAEAKTGRASRYDQAEDIFNKVTRRKTSRFTRPGPNVGILCTLSSTSHPGEFTERRQKEVLRENLKHVYLYNKAQYDVQPSERYGGEKFYVCIHSDAASTIELKDWSDSLPKEADVYEVPVELRDDFVRDPEGATRDIIGRSTRSLSPFITRRTAIHEAVELWNQGNFPTIVQEMNSITEYGLPRVDPDAYCKNPSKPRYVHIDLSHTGDRLGIAMLRFDGVAEMVRNNGEVERLPTCVVELAISLEPDISQGIDLAEVRSWVRKLKTEYGYPIRVVSYDGWNSLESRQQWKKQGMSSLVVSVDKTTVPYKNLRDALYDGRIALYPNQILIEELFDLEEDKEKEKIDHPPDSSKDIADAVCGAYHTMLNRASTWRSEDIDNPRSGGEGRYDSDRAELGERY